MTEEITEAIRNAFNEYLNAVDKIILENQALQIELQHLKQENEELRKIYNENLNQEYDKRQALKQENEKLKHRNENLRIALSTYEMPEVVKVLTDYRTGELQLQENKLNTYRSALEEIREILLEHSCADTHTTKYITTKINEVLK